jgi:predicted outer membrane repeat protein
MKSYAAALSLLALLLIAQPVPGAIVRVPADYPTIQEGINAASGGDTVIVASGTYSGDMNVELRFGGRPIDLRSEAGAESTVIECGWHERGMIFTGTAEDSTLSVSGFTLHGGDDSYDLVVTQEGASPVFEECVFDSDDYDAVWTLAESCPTFRNCDFTARHRGVVCDESSGPRFFSCRFADCRSSAVHCNVLDPPYPFFSDCLFERNRSATGGAVCVRSSGHAGPGGAESPRGGGSRDQFRLESCTFLNNRSSGYGGAFCCIESSPAEIVLDGCTFVGNEASVSGGAVYNIFGAVTLSGSLLLRNSAQKGGGVFATSGLRIVRCTIAANASPQSSGIHIPPGGSGVQIERSIIALGVEGPAVECGSGEVSFDHCVVFENAGGNDLCDNPDNIEADPLFCDSGADDFTLCADSICLPAGNPWGELIGAFEQGCPPCATVTEELSWGQLKALFRSVGRGRRLPN